MQSHDNLPDCLFLVLILTRLPCQRVKEIRAIVCFPSRHGPTPLTQADVSLGGNALGFVWLQACRSLS
jgi:hypothetical protein